MKARTFTTFTSWREVLIHVMAGKPVWYQAPLDYRPVRVRTHPTAGNKLRVFPPAGDADPFVADAGHVDRFRREA